MRSKLLILSLLSVTIPAVAQQSDISAIRVQGDRDHVTPMAWMTNNRSICDSSRLIVSYQFEQLWDTIQCKRCSNLMYLQIGTAKAKYFSAIRDLQDARARVQQTGLGYATLDSLKIRIKQAGDVNMNGEIWTNFPTHRLLARYHAYNIDNQAIVYDESIADLQWIILPDTMIVAGYTCQAASAKFRGRSWKAWFTVEIPLDVGPWKLHGLPGLILRAEDASGHFLWSCIEIKTTKEPIVFDRVKEIIATRNQCEKLLASVFRNPAQVIFGDAHVRIATPQNGGMEFTEGEEWCRTYNPLELE